MELAAYLKHPASLILFPEPKLPLKVNTIDPYGYDIPVTEQVLLGGSLSHRLTLHIAADFAEHVLPIWEAHNPDDDRPATVSGNSLPNSDDSYAAYAARAADFAAGIEEGLEEEWQRLHLIGILLGHHFQGLTANNWGRVANKVERGLHIEGKRGTRRRRTIYITPYVQQTEYPLESLIGAWRVSMLIGNRPFGHQYYKTKEDAIRSLVKSTGGLLGPSSWVYNASQGRISSYGFGEGNYFKSYIIEHPLRIVEIA